ncbi:hypothetical protein BDR03DRAFT_1009470 [Suillus americanus]|nr:hypothetical protein BDR03DRAFT_1009470 [Suillus americanus]
MTFDNDEVPQSTAQHAVILIPEQEQLDNDNSGDFSMFSDVQEDVQARPAPLVNYASELDSDFDAPLLGQASPIDQDSDIEFPSLAQPASTCYIPPAYYVSPSLKRKITEEDLLSPSSEIEVLDGPDQSSVVVKKEPEPVTLWQTSATSVTERQKDPAVKRLKTSAAGKASCASIAPSSQATEMPKIVLSRSQYRMKHLPDACQTLGKWSSMFIPTLIYCIGNQDKVWAIKDNSLSATLQLIWDAVYKGVLYVVTTDGPVIAMVSAFKPHSYLSPETRYFTGPSAVVRMAQQHQHHCPRCICNIPMLTA